MKYHKKFNDRSEAVSRAHELDCANTDHNIKKIDLHFKIDGTVDLAIEKDYNKMYIEAKTDEQRLDIIAEAIGIKKPLEIPDGISEEEYNLKSTI